VDAIILILIRILIDDDDTTTLSCILRERNGRRGNKEAEIALTEEERFYQQLSNCMKKQERL
jgi:hypothetical protein